MARVPVGAVDLRVAVLVVFVVEVLRRDWAAASISHTPDSIMAAKANVMILKDFILNVFVVEKTAHSKKAVFKRIKSYLCKKIVCNGKEPIY